MTTLKIYYNKTHNYYFCTDKNEFDINKLNKLFLEVKIRNNRDIRNIFKSKLKIDSNGYSGGVSDDIHIPDAPDVPDSPDAPREKNTLNIKIDANIINLMKIFTSNEDITSEVAGFLLPKADLLKIHIEKYQDKDFIILGLHKKLIKGINKGAVCPYSMDYNFIFHTHTKIGYHIPSASDISFTFTHMINSIIKKSQPQMHFVFCLNSVYSISLSSEITDFIINFLHESSELHLEFFFKERFLYVFDKDFLYWEEIKKTYNFSDLDFLNDPNNNLVGEKVSYYLNTLSVGDLYKLFRIKTTYEYQEYEYNVMAKMISFFSKKLPSYLADLLSFNNLFYFFKNNIQNQEYEKYIIQTMSHILLFRTKFHPILPTTYETGLYISCENIAFDYTNIAIFLSNGDLVDFKKPLSFYSEEGLVETMKNLPDQIFIDPSLRLSVKERLEYIKKSESYLIVQ